MPTPSASPTPTPTASPTPTPTPAALVFGPVTLIHTFQPPANYDDTKVNSNAYHFYDGFHQKNLATRGQLFSIGYDGKLAQILALHTNPMAGFNKTVLMPEVEKFYAAAPPGYIPNPASIPYLKVLPFAGVYGGMNFPYTKTHPTNQSFLFHFSPSGSAVLNKELNAVQVQSEPMWNGTKYLAWGNVYPTTYTTPQWLNISSSGAILSQSPVTPATDKKPAAWTFKDGVFVLVREKTDSDGAKRVYLEKRTDQGVLLTTLPLLTVASTYQALTLGDSFLIVDGSNQASLFSLDGVLTATFFPTAGTLVPFTSFSLLGEKTLKIQDKILFLISGDSTSGLHALELAVYHQSGVLLWRASVRQAQNVFFVNNIVDTGGDEFAVFHTESNPSSGSSLCLERFLLNGSRLPSSYLPQSSQDISAGAGAAWINGNYQFLYSIRNHSDSLPDSFSLNSVQLGIAPSPIATPAPVPTPTPLPGNPDVALSPILRLATLDVPGGVPNYHQALAAKGHIAWTAYDEKTRKVYAVTSNPSGAYATPYALSPALDKSATCPSPMTYYPKNSLSGDPRFTMLPSGGIFGAFTLYTGSSVYCNVVSPDGYLFQISPYGSLPFFTKVTYFNPEAQPMWSGSDYLVSDNQGGGWVNVAANGALIEQNWLTHPSPLLWIPVNQRFMTIRTAVNSTTKMVDAFYEEHGHQGQPLSSNKFTSLSAFVGAKLLEGGFMLTNAWTGAVSLHTSSGSLLSVVNPTSGSALSHIDYAILSSEAEKIQDKVIFLVSGYLPSGVKALEVVCFNTSGTFLWRRLVPGLSPTFQVRNIVPTANSEFGLLLTEVTASYAITLKLERYLLDGTRVSSNSKIPMDTQYLGKRTKASWINGGYQILFSKGFSTGFSYDATNTDYGTKPYTVNSVRVLP